MKSRILVASAAAVMMLVATLYAEDNLKGIKCIISGQPVQADKTVDHKGGKVYFCCEKCPKSFDAAKHGTKANHQLVLTGQYVQKACPITGKELDSSTAIDVNGAKVAFCCNNCKGAVSKADDAAKGEKVFADKAFEKAFKKADKKS